MSRRRMMMLQLSKPDYIEGRRRGGEGDKWNYYLGSKWIADDIVRLSHTSWSFMGPSSASKAFIAAGDVTATNIGSVFTNAVFNTPLPYTESGKVYRLKMTLINVEQNTATPTNDGVFKVGFGYKGANYNIVSKSISEMVEGTTFELRYRYPVAGAVFEVTNPNLQWIFDFKVEIEEV